MAESETTEHADAAAGSEHAAQPGEHGAAHAHDPLSAEHLISHVKDSEYFELPRPIGKVHIPQPFKTSQPIFTIHTGFAPLDDRIEPPQLRLTKFMVLETIVAIVLVIVFTRLAARLKNGAAPKGSLTNLLEAMVVFIRDDVARPAIGRHDADRFLPYLLTVFFFILTCNLFGLLPWAGSATGALATTGMMAFLTFATVIFSGMFKLGPVKFWLSQVPHMDLPMPWPIAFVLRPGIFAIEVLGPVHQALHPGHASVGQHDGRPPGAGRDPGIHRRQRHGPGVVCGHAGQRAGRRGLELVGAVRGFFAGVHLHVFVGVVHWHGVASALVGTKTKRPPELPTEITPP